VKSLGGSNMRILVTGGTGLLGYWIVKNLVLKGYDVYATYHEKDPAELDARWLRIDLENAESILNSVREARPDIIIHTAAYTDVDGCEINKEKAFKINYLGTKYLVETDREADLFIYISTDYVFDGEKGFYKEDDVPAPVNYYGLTKLLGEIVVRNILPEKSIVVRVSGLYGYSPIGKRNFGLTALERLLRSEHVEAFTDQWLSPTYVKALSESIIKLVEKDFRGVVHIAGERLSRYEFAIALTDVLGVDKDLVKPISMNMAKLIARRPRDSSLDTSKARELGLSIPSLKDNLRDMVNTYREFRER
jgi:dTDP-4-dehydrorhamnose reductase